MISAYKKDIQIKKNSPAFIIGHMLVKIVLQNTCKKLYTLKKYFAKNTFIYTQKIFCETHVKSYLHSKNLYQHLSVNKFFIKKIHNGKLIQIELFLPAFIIG